jgi:Fe-S-cluster containining protein
MSSPRDFENRVNRYGIQALYTFTPFKLLRSQQGSTYEVILAETYHHKVNIPGFRWYSQSVKDEFYVNTPAGHRKKIVQPYELYSVQFSNQNNQKYIFEPRNQPQWRYYPEYMEFSLEAFRKGYYCHLGFVLLSSKDDNCPIRRDCPHYKGQKRCKYYSSNPMAYSSLYNVYPIIRKKYEPPVDKSEIKPLTAIRYKSMPLVTLFYIPNGRYVAYIDGVQFSLKRALMSRPPILYLKDGLGFRISQASAIQFEFNKDTLRELISDSLNSSQTLVQWVRLKQRLYVDTDNDVYLVREGRGFEAFKQLDDIVKSTLDNRSQTSDIRSIINNTSIDNELVDFASFLFIHSFIHLCLDWVSAKYGYGKGDFGYHIEHDRIRPLGLQEEGVRAFIFEAVVGGLGYLESFAQDIRDKNMLDELIGNKNQGIQAVLEFCEKRSSQAHQNLPIELAKFRNNNKINSLIDKILKVYNTFGNNVYPHVNSIRRIVGEDINESQTRGLLDDILGRTPHCWDGCQLCVMLERGCNYSPFDQPFLVSNKLTTYIIGSIKKMINQPREVYPLNVGVYNEFQRFIASARQSIRLVSPWISHEIVRTLVERANKSGVEVQIITTKDTTNKSHEDSLRYLTEVSNNIKIKIYQNLHAKGMLIDSVMLLTGSFNFTYAGLTSNVENLIVDFSIEGTNDFIRKFDDLWNKSQPLDRKE